MRFINGCSSPYCKAARCAPGCPVCQDCLNSCCSLKNTYINNVFLQIFMHQPFQLANWCLVSISSEKKNKTFQPYINYISSETTVGKFGNGRKNWIRPQGHWKDNSTRKMNELEASVSGLGPGTVSLDALGTLRATVGLVWGKYTSLLFS